MVPWLLTQGIVKEFVAKKSINEMEHPPHSPALAVNDVLFPKIVCLEGMKISGYWRH